MKKIIKFEILFTKVPISRSMFKLKIPSMTQNDRLEQGFQELFRAVNYIVSFLRYAPFIEMDALCDN